MFRKNRPLSSLQTFKFSLALVFVVISIGATGFYFLEKSAESGRVEEGRKGDSPHSFLDAVYWSIITATTTGYGDFVPKTGWGRVFTVFFAIIAVVTIAWAGANALAFIVEGHLTEAVRVKKMEKDIKALKNHYIICGLGRVGMEVVQRLRESKIHRFVVVDRHREILENTLRDDELFVVGDATEDQVLKDAQIELAYGLIACIPDDAANVFTILTAKVLNPKLFVIARGQQDGSQKKLMRAGANRVVMPSRIGGARMAAMALRPAIVDFLDQTLLVPGDREPLLLEEILIESGNPMMGKMLKETHIKSETEVMIIGIRPNQGDFLINPPSNYIIGEGDMLIGLGHHTHFKMLRRLMGLPENAS
ncbi:MAG: NAD-binding protein [Candidatus Omnitrophota bacterium]